MAERLPERERHRLVSAGVVQMVVPLLPSVLSLLVLPILAKHLPDAALGAWFSALATSAVLTSVDFGLSATVRREVARRIAVAGDESLSGILGTAASAYLLVALGDVVVLGAMGLLLASR